MLSGPVEQFDRMLCNSSMTSLSNAVLGRPVSRKPRELFRLVKPFLVHLYLKTAEKCMRLKLFVWREPPFILRICNYNIARTLVLCKSYRVIMNKIFTYVRPASIKWRVQFHFSCKISVEFSASSLCFTFGNVKNILNNPNPDSEEWSSQLIFQFKQLERRSLKKSGCSKAD